MNQTDIKHLTRCVDLAEQALDTNNDPFGSLLVDRHGKVLWEGYNLGAGGDETQHPEFNVARWAAQNMSETERATSVVYTSGEHCAMCSAAHAWVGLGKIVYALSNKELAEWRRGFGSAAGPVKVLSIGEVVEGIEVDGPEPSLSARLKALHRRRYDETHPR